MLRNKLEKVRSNHGIVQSEIDVKSWLASLPSVSDVRPAHCVECHAASRVVGERLAVHGHGTVERQVCGPLTPEGKPKVVIVLARRYQCQRCSAVMTVVPRGVLHRMWYAASAIGLALFLYGVEGLSAAAVRARLSTWPAQDASMSGWPALRRWITRAWSLWSLARQVLPDASTRQQAERAAMELVAHAQIAGDATSRVFDGAVRTR